MDAAGAAPTTGAAGAAKKNDERASTHISPLTGVLFVWSVAKLAARSFRLCLRRRRRKWPLTALGRRRNANELTDGAQTTLATANKSPGRAAYLCARGRSD